MVKRRIVNFCIGIRLGVVDSHVHIDVAPSHDVVKESDCLFDREVINIKLNFSSAFHVKARVTILNQITQLKLSLQNLFVSTRVRIFEHLTHDFGVFVVSTKFVCVHKDRVQWAIKRPDL